MKRTLILRRAFGIGLAAFLPLSSFAADPPASPDQVAVQTQKAHSKSGWKLHRLQFEANQGQAEKKTRFLTQGEGYRLWLNAQEVVMDLENPAPGEEETAAPSRLRMRLLGSRPRPAVRGLWKSGERVSAFQAGDARRRAKKIPTFEKVLYERVYPGINLVFYGLHTQLEYDFVVYPHNDPGKIHLACEGADRIELSEAGDLLMFTSSGVVRQKKPVMFQVIDSYRREVSGGYRLEAGGVIRFQIDAYDPAHPLVIDPVVVYTPRAGGGKMR